MIDSTAVKDATGDSYRAAMDEIAKHEPGMSGADLSRTFLILGTRMLANAVCMVPAASRDEMTSLMLNHPQWLKRMLPDAVAQGEAVLGRLHTTETLQ